MTAAVVAIMVVVLAQPAQTHAACTTPPVDYGEATVEISIAKEDTYRIWTRMLLPNEVANSYLLEINGDECIIVGGEEHPAGEWFWVDYRDGDTSSKIDVQLSEGTHTLRLIGAYPDVQIGYLLLTPDLDCIPEGDGSNCATEDGVVQVGNGDGSGDAGGEVDTNGDLLAPTGNSILLFTIVGGGSLLVGAWFLWRSRQNWIKGLFLVAFASSALVTASAGVTTATPSPDAIRFSPTEGTHNDRIAIEDDAIRFTYESIAPDYVSWGDIRQWTANNYRVKDIAETGQAAHLNIVEWSFGKISPDGLCVEEQSFDLGAQTNYLNALTAEQSIDGIADKDGQPVAGAYNQLRKLKAKYPGMKIYMELGGWGWSQYFNDLANTEEKRQAFVESCVDLYIKGNLPELAGRGGEGVVAGLFDGISVDWEWPAAPAADGHPFGPEDKANYVALMQEFRDQLDAQETVMGADYELAFILPNGDTILDDGFDPQLYDIADYAVLTGFDFASSSLAIHAANTQPTGTQWISARNLVNANVNRGADPSKIVIATTAFARIYATDSDDNNGLYQTFTSYEGTLPYHEVVNRAGTRFYDDTAKAPWKFESGPNLFYTYDDPEGIADKLQYIQDNNLAGIELWALDGDLNGELVRAMGGQ